jgi:hypothetical protein
MELTHFSFSVDDGIATVLLDRAGQPVNTIGPAIFGEFTAVVERIEADPTRVHTGLAQTLRNFLGHKTMVFWENYDLEHLLDYGNLSAEQMAEALSGLADYTIIASLRIAAAPSSGADTPERLPWNPPIGVRAPFTMTTASSAMLASIRCSACRKGRHSTQLLPNPCV